MRRFVSEMSTCVKSSAQSVLIAEIITEKNYTSPSCSKMSKSKTFIKSNYLSMNSNRNQKSSKHQEIISSTQQFGCVGCGCILFSDLCSFWHPHHRVSNLEQQIQNIQIYWMETRFNAVTVTHESQG